MLFCISFDVALFPLAVKGRELKVFGRSLVCSVSVCIFSYSMLPQISLHGLLGIEFSGYKFLFLFFIFFYSENSFSFDSFFLWENRNFMVSGGIMHCRLCSMMLSVLLSIMGYVLWFFHSWVCLKFN